MHLIIGLEAVEDREQVGPPQFVAEQLERVGGGTSRDVGGGPAQAPDQRANEPPDQPSLLITARRDRLVSPGNSRRMAAKIRDHGGVAEELTYGGVGHLTLIGAFAPGLRVLAPVLRDATQFVWRVTRWPLNGVN